ncbi:hypothetical protein BGZ94_007254 [Podila epigama]|nr:hypothetical protein BGZ94_007254 [Podila epigama]
MATSTLKLAPSSISNDSTLTCNDSLTPSDSATASRFGLKRLKVYSSCLRCRAKKVKCDRKEPCSRCEKHSVECSYRELASVKLDIRPFKRQPATATATASSNTPANPPTSSSPASSASSVSSSSTTAAFSVSSTGGLTTTKVKRQNNNALPSIAEPSTSDHPPFLSSSPLSILLSAAAASSPPSSTRSTLGPKSHNEALANSPSPHSSAASSPHLAHITTTTISSNNNNSIYNNYDSHNSNRKSSKTRNRGSDTTDIEYSETPFWVSAPAPAATSVAPISSAKDRARVHKIHRRKPSTKSSQQQQQAPLDRDSSEPITSSTNQLCSSSNSSSDGFEHVDRVTLSEFTDSSMTYSHVGQQEKEQTYADIPIWHAQAIGKHTQTAHEQDMADTFGLAAYLQAREMEIRQDPGKAGQAIDYEMELEAALAQRMPTSFSRLAQERSSSGRSPRKYSFNPSAGPYARPSYCQLSSPLSSNSSTSYNSKAAVSTGTGSKSFSSSQSTRGDRVLSAPVAAHCCCQIAAQQGQALSSCPYSNVSHSGYEKPGLTALTSAAQSISLEGHSETARIAYSPSYSPEYEREQKQNEQQQERGHDQFSRMDWSSVLPLPRIQTSQSSSSYTFSSSKMEMSSPTSKLAPIRLPIIVSPTASSSSSSSSSSLDSSLYQVGRDDDEPMKIECKYNEPNVDAWDLIEKPLSRAAPVSTIRGRSAKMEMGWILS